MQLDPDDPRLTAAALGELKDGEAAAIANTADPAIRAELEEIRALQQFLDTRLTPGGEKLLPQQRENILRAAREASPASARFSLTRLQVYFIPAAAAAVLGLATFLLVRMAPEEPATAALEPPAGKSSPPQSLPAAPIAPGTPPASPPSMAGRGSLFAADDPVLELPVTAHDRSYGEVASVIREKGKLPADDEVRLEELLNHFTYRFTGVAAIARSAAATWHPDNRDTGMTRHVATLSTEAISCPWKPSATLLLINLRGNSQSDSTVTLRYRAAADNVVRYRLLGYPPDGAPGSGEMSQRLPAGAITTLALEIQSLNPRGQLGQLEWTADDASAPPIAISHPADAEPSDDARFAALVCTFAQWLAGEQAGVIDADILAAFARENARPDLSTDRAEFLELVNRALHL